MSSQYVIGLWGKCRALQEQWTDVIQEAAGEKVLVNTSKIKKVLKRREKGKEKSAREWQVSIVLCSCVLLCFSSFRVALRTY